MTIYKEYINKRDQYKLEYPENWEIFEPEIDLFSVDIREPIDNTYKHRASVMVNVIDLTKNPMTLKETITKTPEQLKIFLNEFKLLSEKELILGRIKARQAEYSGINKIGQLKGVHLQYSQTWSIKQNIWHALTYSAEPDRFSNHLVVLDHVIQSYEFI